MLYSNHIYVRGEANQYWNIPIMYCDYIIPCCCYSQLRYWVHSAARAVHHWRHPTWWRWSAELGDCLPGTCPAPGRRVDRAARAWRYRCSAVARSKIEEASQSIWMISCREPQKRYTLRVGLLKPAAWSYKNLVRRSTEAVYHPSLTTAADSFTPLNRYLIE